MRHPAWCRLGRMGKRIDFEQDLSKRSQRRWTRQHAKAVLAAWHESGLSMSAYAREHRLNGQRLSWWRKRLGDGQKNDAAIAFIPGLIKEPTGGIVVRLPGGIEIETTDVTSVPASWLAAVVGALEHAG